MARHGGRRRLPAKQKRYASQAQLEAYVQYAPQQAALRGLLRDAAAEYRTGTAADRGASRMIQRSARSARPAVSRDYRRSIKSVKSQDAAVKRTLTNLGPSAKPFLAAIAREGAGTRGRLQESRASTLQELESRRVDAAAGFAAALRQRAGDFKRTSEKVHQSQLDLARQKGAFQAATIGDLAEADRKLRVQMRGQDKTYQASRRNAKLAHRDRAAALGEKRQHDRAMEEAAKRRARAAARNKGKGPKRVTGSQRGQAIDGIQLARQWINRLGESKKLSPDKIKNLLIRGETIQDAKGNKITVPKIGHAGPIPGSVLVNAAFQLQRSGRIHGHTRHALRGAGLPHGWTRGRKALRRRGRAEARRIPGFF